VSKGVYRVIKLFKYMKIVLTRNLTLDFNKINF
jgi:hypothetical protein